MPFAAQVDSNYGTSLPDMLESNDLQSCANQLWGNMVFHETPDPDLGRDLASIALKPPKYIRPSLGLVLETKYFAKDKQRLV